LRSRLHGCIRARQRMNIRLLPGGLAHHPRGEVLLGEEHTDLLQLDEPALR